MDKGKRKSVKLINATDFWLSHFTLLFQKKIWCCEARNQNHDNLKGAYFVTRGGMKYLVEPDMNSLQQTSLNSVVLSIGQKRPTHPRDNTLLRNSKMK